MVVWQATNDLKKKFYAVVLAQSLLNLANENQKTFAEVIKDTAELVQAGEIAGLDLTRLEVEQLKFDTDCSQLRAGLRSGFKGFASCPRRGLSRDGDRRLRVT